jgi:hypothetical protein
MGALSGCARQDEVIVLAHTVAPQLWNFADWLRIQSLSSGRNIFVAWTASYMYDDGDTATLTERRGDYLGKRHKATHNSLPLQRIP